MIITSSSNQSQQQPSLIINYSGLNTTSSSESEQQQQVITRRETILQKLNRSNSSSTTTTGQNSSTTTNQVITLNVGGVLYTTFKETLSTKINGKDHLLSIIFSESCFEFSKDERGNIFIDRNGKVFSYILDYLRAEGNIDKFALPFHDNCLMEQLEMEVEYFSLIDLSILLRGRRKCFKIEKKKYSKSKTPTTTTAATNTGNNSSIPPPTVSTTTATVGALVHDDKELDEGGDELDDTSSILLDEEDDDSDSDGVGIGDDGDDRELDYGTHVSNLIVAGSGAGGGGRGSIIDDSSDDDDNEFEKRRAPSGGASSATTPIIHQQQHQFDLNHVGDRSSLDETGAATAAMDEVLNHNDDEEDDSVSTFDAAIKSVNQVLLLPTPLVAMQSLKPPSPSIAKQKSHKRTKSTSLFHSYHNIKHRICNDKGEPVIGYSEDASVCYIFPNLSRYYYPINCKQPIQLRGIDRRFSKSHNYYEITIRSDLEDRIDYVNYNIPGIVVAVMTNNQIKTIKQHHKKDLPIDLKKETVTNFNLKNGSYYSNEDGKHVIAIRRYLCGDRVGVHVDTTTKLITFYYNDNVLFTSQFQYDDLVLSRSRLYFVVLVKSTYGVVPSFIHLRSHAQHPFKYTSSQFEENDSRKLKFITKRLGDLLSGLNTESEQQGGNGTNSQTTGTQKSNKR